MKRSAALCAPLLLAMALAACGPAGSPLAGQGTPAATPASPAPSAAPVPSPARPVLNTTCLVGWDSRASIGQPPVARLLPGFTTAKPSRAQFRAQNGVNAPGAYANWLAGQAGYEVVLTNPESGTTTGAYQVTVVFYAADGTETGSSTEATVERVIVPGGIFAWWFTDLPAGSATCSIVGWA